MPSSAAKSAGPPLAAASSSVVTDGFYIGLALMLNTLAPVMVKMTQNADGGYSYNKWCIYFFAELIKLIVAGSSCCLLRMDSSKESRDQLAMMQFDFKENLRYALPGFLFFAQNNLSFLALQHLSNSAFQLLLNTRIVAVAFLSVVMLRKRLNAIEWVAIVLCMVGATQYNLSSCSAEGDLKISSEGLLVMVVIICCAAAGNVYTQLVMQTKMGQPLMFQNAQLYLYGVVFNGVNWVNGSRVAPAFGEIGGAEVFSMFFYAVYGLSISVILKRFGAMTRTFINAAAIVLNAAIDVTFFGTTISILEATCFVVILIAILLHSNLARHYKPEP